MVKVFVYGTLKSDYRNHGVLHSDHSAETPATFLGVATTVSKHCMIGENRPFPYVTKTPNNTFLLQFAAAIKGELYEVSDATLSNLDRLEGYNPEREHNHYDRITISAHLEDGSTVDNVFMYAVDPNEFMAKGAGKFDQPINGDYLEWAPPIHFDPHEEDDDQDYEDEPEDDRASQRKTNKCASQ